MKGRRKTIYDALTGVRIDVLHGDDGYCSAFLKKLGWMMT